MLHDRVLPEPQTRPADVRKRWVPGRGRGSLAPRHPAGGRMRAGPGGTDGASAADHGEDRRRVGTRATSPTVPGAGRGAGTPWRKRSHAERLGGCRQPRRESRSLTTRFTRGADVHQHSDTAAELGAPAPALRADCACALGGDGGQATHEDGHPSVCAECWGGERTAAGRDGTCWRGAGGRERLRLVVGELRKAALRR